MIKDSFIPGQYAQGGFYFDEPGNRGFNIGALINTYTILGGTYSNYEGP